MTADVVELVAAAAVDVTKFVTASQASAEAFKTATLLKSLDVNALIVGQSGVGKRTLASFILPNAVILSGSQYEEILAHIEESDELIIINIEDFANIKRLFEAIQQHNVRIVATSKYHINYEEIDEIFSIVLEIPPLNERPEDVEALIDLFITDAVALFGGEHQFDVHHFIPNLEENANSLKRQVMIHYLLQDLQDDELMQIIENYLYDKLGSNSDYRNFLYLYEVPLIRAGLNRFKSQLQLSDRLGLNRNTLRKKIAEHKDYLQGD